MRQWLRQCRLVIGKNGKGLDLSALRITFDVKKNDQTTPNSARICVYNPAPEDIANAEIPFEPKRAFPLRSFLLCLALFTFAADVYLRRID